MFPRTFTWVQPFQIGMARVEKRRFDSPDESRANSLARYQASQCTIVSSGLRRAGRKSVPIVYATGINATCMTSA